jgi:hypothetical protein
MQIKRVIDAWRCYSGPPQFLLAKQPQRQSSLGFNFTSFIVLLLTRKSRSDSVCLETLKAEKPSQLFYPALVQL